VAITNTSPYILRNLTVELCTSNQDVKIISLSKNNINLAESDMTMLNFSIRFTSTTTIKIVGCVNYNAGKTGIDSYSISLNEVTIPAMFWFEPQSCDSAKFRKMWSEFEWENKVTVRFYKISIEKFNKMLEE